jgi:hypothetical protein
MSESDSSIACKVRIRQQTSQEPPPERPWIFEVDSINNLNLWSKFMHIMSLAIRCKFREPTCNKSLQDAND